MRRTIISLGALFSAGLIVTLAGGQAPQTSTPATNGDQQAIQQAVTAYCDAFNRGDIQAIASYWAPDAEYTDESGTTHKGRDAIVALFRKEVLWGIVLIVVGFLVGPGGVSVFT